jgi:hypothetical protein
MITIAAARADSVSFLLGARLRFDHLVTRRPDGGCTIDVTVTRTGPLRSVWARILAKGLRASAQPDLDRRVQAAESPR